MIFTSWEEDSVDSRIYNKYNFSFAYDFDHNLARDVLIVQTPKDYAGATFCYLFVYHVSVVDHCRENKEFIAVCESNKGISTVQVDVLRV